MKKRDLFLINFLLSFLVISPFQNSIAQVNPKEFDEFLPTLMDSALIPGMSISLIENNRILSSKNFGVIKEGKQREIGANTVFEAASLTKSIAAYCALKLVEKGLLELDKPLYHYLEYGPVADDDRYHLITARMVLSHQSGFPNWRADRNSNSMKIKFDPGSKFGYSGEGFVYLQKVMEKITGKNLDQLAHEWVFEPLGMEHSSLIFPDTKDFAVGHNENSKPRKKSKPSTPNAAYSMHTNSDDYAKFLIELMDPIFVDKDLVKQAMVEEVLMNSEDPSLGWALGLGTNNTSSQNYLWHWGDNGVFRAFFIISPDNGKGFVYFSNSQNGLSVVHRLIQFVFDDPEVMENWQEYAQF